MPRYESAHSFATPRFSDVRTFMRPPNVRDLDNADAAIVGAPPRWSRREAMNMCGWLPRALASSRDNYMFAGSRGARRVLEQSGYTPLLGTCVMAVDMEEHRACTTGPGWV